MKKGVQRTPLKGKKGMTIDDLAVMVAAGFEGVDRRFEGVDRRFEGVDKKFERIEHKMEGMATKDELKKLEKKMDDGFAELHHAFNNHVALVRSDTDDLAYRVKRLEETVFNP
ncbi:hypothetical protein L0Y46_00695 [bacterium]|nr:hypothetical protein [bacterium]